MEEPAHFRDVKLSNLFVNHSIPDTRELFERIGRAKNGRELGVPKL
jgi:hypothetical protein